MLRLIPQYPQLFGQILNGYFVHSSQDYSPAGQDLAGGHREAVLQGGHTVLDSKDGALKTRFREKLHLRRTQ